MACERVKLTYRISGNFRLDNSTQLPTTLVQGYDVLSPDSFQFKREEITEKREVRIDMKTTAQISKLLTFGVYGRDLLKDGGPVTELCGSVRSDAASASLVLSIAVFLYVRSHCWVLLLTLCKDVTVRQREI